MKLKNTRKGGIKKFLLSEEGKFSKKKLLKITSLMLLANIFLEDNTALATHSSHTNTHSSGSWLENPSFRGQHQSIDTHTSHSNHSSHCNDDLGQGW